MRHSAPQSQSRLKNLLEELRGILEDQLQCAARKDYGAVDASSPRAAELIEKLAAMGPDELAAVQDEARTVGRLYHRLCLTLHQHHGETSKQKGKLRRGSHVSAAYQRGAAGFPNRRSGVSPL